MSISSLDPQSADDRGPLDVGRRFSIDDERVRRLSATRQGRITLGGFAYQAAYAVARLASLHARRPVLGLPDIPILLRYDWAEDLDEIDAEGRTILTQCKRISDIGQPASLAGVLLGLAPKWLWASESERQDLRLRLVCTDPRFRGHGPVLLRAGKTSGGPDRERVLAAVVATLRSTPDSSSDRAVWQAAAEAAGLNALARALWEQTEVLYLAADPLPGDPGGPLLPAEREALNLLLMTQAIDASRQKPALDALRSLVHSNVVELDLTGDGPVPPQDREPRVLAADDVRYRLFPFQSPRDKEPPFQIVTRRFLADLESEAKEPYVARPPGWRDVVHGQDPEIKFLERERTLPLLECVRGQLRGLGTGEPLPALFVLGAPGAGKTTLTRRVAALVVQEGLAVAAAPKVNLDRIEPEAMEPFLDALSHLEEGPLPVLLVLDDPFFADSGWMDLLRRLAATSRRIAVLGATPDYLFQEHGHALETGRQIQCQTFQLPKPEQREREELARLHHRDPESLSRRDDDFLVLAMEASAGESFGEIIRRLWITLHNGLSIPPRTRPEDLPWTVRAYLLACYCHRVGLSCSERLMRAVLDHSGRDRPPGGARQEIAWLKNEQGWRVFSVSAPEAGYLSFLGDRIATAHPLVAAEAWRRRPAKAFDVGEWILEALPDAQAAAMDLGALAVRLSRESDESDRSFLRRLVTAWNEAAVAGRVETRNLCLLHSVLALQDSAAAARALAPGLKACVLRLDGQSWLAALTLLRAPRREPATQAADQPLGRLGVDLLQLLGVADLHLAPNRATQLAGMLKASPEAHAALLDRIQATADHPQAYHLLSLLAAARPGNAAVMETALAWLDAHSPQVGAGGSLELLKSLVAASSGEPRVVERALAWIEEHFWDARVPQLLRPLTVANPANDQVIGSVNRWAGANVESPRLLWSLMPLLRPEGTHPETIRHAVSWLDVHPGDSAVPHLLARLLAVCGGQEDLLRRGAEYLDGPRRLGKERIALALLGASRDGADWARFLDRVLASRSTKLTSRRWRDLAKALAANPGAALDYLSADPEPSRKVLVLDHLAIGLRGHPEALSTFFAGIEALPEEDVDALLAQMVYQGVEGEPLDDRLIRRLAATEDGPVWKAVQRKVETRNRLLARPDLPAGIRAGLPKSP